MRLRQVWFALLLAGGLGGCPQDVTTAPEDVAPATVVAGATEVQGSSGAETRPPASSGPLTLSGTIAGAGDYAWLPITAARAGEAWVLSDARGRLGNEALLVCLFNADYELLQRELVSAAAPLEHLVRADTPNVYVGVTAASGRSGGEFRLQITRRATATPGPVAQAVWLNFNGAANVAVHGRKPLTFPAFDAAMLGSAYAGQTAAVKRAIVAAVREDYAGYNVWVLTSDEGPPPSGPHATLHFGGRDGQLLGLADSVDQYNTDPWQTAVIYVESFADFAGMGLSAAEIGQMVGNVASHELGHLLGLYHTCVPTDVMDTTGTAWDLADDQTFSRAALEQTVFPYGYENSPRRLAEIVGAAPPDAGLAKPATTAKMLRKAALRALVRAQAPSRCGTCLHLDE